MKDEEKKINIPDKELEEREETKENEELTFDEAFEKDKSLKKRIIIFSGTFIVILFIVLILYYFFVYRVDLLINISTEKQIEVLETSGNKEQITTQKFISDLNYSMRYDVAKFSVFKYLDQDIYKGIENEDVLVVVEKAKAPSNCSGGSNDLISSYNNCNILVDNETEEFYIYNKEYSYKIMVKKPVEMVSNDTYDLRISQMLKSFTIS